MVMFFFPLPTRINHFRRSFLIEGPLVNWEIHHNSIRHRRLWEFFEMVKIENPWNRTYDEIWCSSFSGRRLDDENYLPVLPHFPLKMSNKQHIYCKWWQFFSIIRGVPHSLKFYTPNIVKLVTVGTQNLCLKIPIFKSCWVSSWIASSTKKGLIYIWVFARLYRGMTIRPYFATCHTIQYN